MFLQKSHIFRSHLRRSWLHICCITMIASASCNEKLLLFCYCIFSWATILSYASFIKHVTQIRCINWCIQGRERTPGAPWHTAVRQAFHNVWQEGYHFDCSSAEERSKSICRCSFGLIVELWNMMLKKYAFFEFVLLYNTFDAVGSLMFLYVLQNISWQIKKM